MPSKPSTPGVEVAFVAIAGPMLFRADLYRHWQDNVRAVALTLRALRAINRYGASSSGEQYTGYLVIAATRAPMDMDTALLFIWLMSGLARDSVPLTTAIARAKRNCHPDGSGSHVAWLDLQEALTSVGLS